MSFTGGRSNNLHHPDLRRQHEYAANLKANTLSFLDRNSEAAELVGSPGFGGQLRTKFVCIGCFFHLFG